MLEKKVSIHHIMILIPICILLIAMMRLGLSYVEKTADTPVESVNETPQVSQRSEPRKTQTENASASPSEVEAERVGEDAKKETGSAEPPRREIREILHYFFNPRTPYPSKNE